MKPFHNLKRTVFLGLLASMFIGSPAFGEISLPTAVKLDKSIYFQNPAGEPVQFQPGIYEVEQNGENALNIEPVGSGAGAPTPIQAIPAGHEEDVEANTAHLVPSPDNNEDKQHLVFVTPDGLALESVGSYSGVFSRSAMTWGEKAGGAEAESEEPLTVSFDKATYFKTIGGDPAALQPGDYEVALVGDGLVLTPSGDTKGEAITVESESLGTSTATIIPEFADNPDLELLMVATAGGQSITALGSHTGTFPRGLRSWYKKAKKKVKGAASKVKRHVVKKARKGIQVVHGKAKKHLKRAYYAAKKRGKAALIKAKSHGWKYAKKYGKRIGKGAWKYGKRAITKLCGKDRKQKCIQMATELVKKGGEAGGS